jgi:hypothetical protein
MTNCLSQNVLPSPRLRGEGPGVRGRGMGSKSKAEPFVSRRLREVWQGTEAACRAVPRRAPCHGGEIEGAGDR